MVSEQPSFISGDRPPSTSVEPPHAVDDEHARLNELFKRWCGPIRHWMTANNRVPCGEADDLAQEVFLRLLRYSDDVLVTNPQGYLFSIAGDVVDRWRRRCEGHSTQDEVGLDDLHVETAEEPENVAARALEMQRLQAVIQRLPARQQEVLRLRVDEGLTYKQIARRRGLTYRIVLRDLTRAYATLRQRLHSNDG